MKQIQLYLKHGVVDEPIDGVYELDTENGEVEGQHDEVERYKKMYTLTEILFR